MKRFVYFYFNRAAPELADFVPEHVRFWRSAGLADYIGGPFGDRSGGLIAFSALDVEEANSLVRQDPFTRRGFIEQSWLKEWVLG